MNRTRGAMVALAAAVAVNAGWSDIAHGEPVLHMAVVGRAIQPGEVIRLDVTCRCGPAPALVTAVAFRRHVALFPARDAVVCQALIGIDLETRPGTYPVTSAIDRPGKPPLTMTQELRVLSKGFPTRRLRVSDNFVNPPQGAVERIRRETDRLQAMFETVTPHRWDGAFWHR